MPMYRKLLISAGGGIICRDEQAEQAEGATIAIGLGGTGISCLRMLKKEVYERLKPDGDSVNGIQNYKHIKFIAVDTDNNSLAANDTVYSIDASKEFVNISCDNIQDLLKNEAALKANRALNWLRIKEDGADGIQIMSARAGAGSVRQVGRLLLFNNQGNFRKLLKAALDDAMKEIPGNAKASIHIFSGMGGGTGSGTFLDVCYMIQHLLERTSKEGRINTFGYFFLPDVNLASITDENASRQIKANGFAAMKELDYCMNFGLNGGKWKEVYDEEDFETTEPPVNVAHLISAENERGERYNDGQDYAMRTVVNYVMDFLVKPKAAEAREGEPAPPPFTLDSHLSNIDAHKQQVRKRYGAGYEYCAIGASNEYVPFKDITTYMTAKIFEKFRGLSRNLPNRNDVENVFNSNGMRLNEIANALESKVPSVPIYDVDPNDIYEDLCTIDVEDLTLPSALQQMRDSSRTRYAARTTNFKAMLDDGLTEDNGANNQATSLIVKLRRHLKGIAADPDRGPYYAAAILKSAEDYDMLNILDGYITNAQTSLKHVYADFPLRDEAVKKAHREVIASNFYNRKKRVNAYVKAAHSHCVQSNKKEHYEKLEELLTSFKKQVSDLYSDFYGILKEVMTNLEKTFAQNLTDLSELQINNEGFSRQIVRITDRKVKDALDENVGRLRTEDLIRRFVEMMLKNENQNFWISQDEDKIAKLISDHFSEVLREYTNKTIKDYLAIRFETNDPTVIQRRTYQDIISPAYGRAAVLFTANQAAYGEDTAEPYGTCSVPQMGNEIVAAAQMINDAHPNITIRPSYCTDRISFLTMNVGIPMFAYSQFNAYRNATPVVGTYLHEGASRDDRDWSKLFSITPVSFRSGEKSDELKARIAIIEAAFEEETGVILRPEQDGRNEYVILGIDDQTYEAAKKTLKDAMDSGNMEEIDNALREYSERIKPNETIRTLRKQGINADDFIKDILIASDVYFEEIKNVMDKLNEIEELRHRLNETITENRIQGQNLEIFASAVFTGVIRAKNRYTYVLLKEDMGVSEEIELTTIEKKPYGEHLPLYSAYLEFANMADTMKEGVRNDTLSRRVNNETEVAEIFGKIKDGTLSDENIKNATERARNSYPTELGEIIQFYRRISFEKNNF